MKTANVTCIECEGYKCSYPEAKKSPPEDCPRKTYPDALKKSLKESRTEASIKKINMACEEVLKNAHDANGYQWTRVRELIEYARFLDYKRIGIAGCIGLIEESKILARILKEAGFEVILVNCKAGGAVLPKFGLKEREGSPFSIACNPLMQAEVLNKEKTELNVMVGLCLGHDILFMKHSKADVTPLIVKDRITGHNPVAVLYTHRTYYKNKLSNPSTGEPTSAPSKKKKRA